MITELRRWLHALPITDPLERRQALLIQSVLIIIGLLAVLALPLALNDSNLASQLRSLASIVAALIAVLLALLALRRARMELAIVVAACGIVLALTVPLISAGINRSGEVLLMLIIPIILVGTLGQRRSLLLASGLSILVVISPLVLAPLFPGIVGTELQTRDQSFDLVGAYLTTVIAVGFTLDRFRSAFADALNAARVRERDLATLSASLEATVAERTAELAAALNEVQARVAEQEQLLNELQRQRATIRELSVPALPVSATTLVMPLVGELTAERLDMLQEQALRAVERSRVTMMVLDISGVPIVDTQVAQGLIKTVQAVRLLGTEITLVGVRPEVAQAIVSLGLDLTGIHTARDLASVVGQ